MHIHVYISVFTCMYSYICIHVCIYIFPHHSTPNPQARNNVKSKSELSMSGKHMECQMVLGWKHINAMRCCT